MTSKPSIYTKLSANSLNNQRRDRVKNTIALSVLLMIASAASVMAQNAPAKDLFASKCAMCHGPDGSAQTTMGKNLKIRDFHSADVQKQSDADLKTVITKGKGKMPAFDGKLTGEQIDQLVGYLRGIGKQK
jgi:mono/diheme cytochrome c family protein